MSFTSEDVRRQFDSATYSRGAEYYRRQMVLTLAVKGTVIESSVRGSHAGSYRQSISLSAPGARTQFDGDCSCPMAYNCKHVVAVLLTALGGAAAPSAPGGAHAAAPALPSELYRWLSALVGTAEAASARPALGKPAPARHAYRLVYLLMPHGPAGALTLFLCKGRVAADGVIRSGTMINDCFNFHNHPPAYLRDADRGPAVAFVGMLPNVWGAPALVPAGEGAARLLAQLLELGVLYRCADKADLKAGLRQVRPGPPRAGGLAWRTDGAQAGLRLGWQLDDGEPIDHVLPTQPPFYLRGDEAGALDASSLPPAVPLAEWVTLVARAPRIAPEHVPLMVEQLLSPALSGLLPLPSLANTRRTGVRPRPVLTLGGVPGYDPVSGAVLHGDYAVPGFDYDGLRVDADPRHQPTRVAGGAVETVARHAEDEAAALATLHGLGFRAGPAALRTPPQPPSAALQLPTEHDWLHFATEHLPGLRAGGWLIDFAPGYRFELAAIDDWYAQVEHDEQGAGSAWLELELGIVVDGARVPLLPVLLQLIRQAPRDFAPAALAARADEELLLARLASGRPVALPWGRIKPILRTLGELYFSDRAGDTLVLPALEMARLAELEACAQLRWLGGERLRALGRKLIAFDGVAPVAAPAGLRAELRPYQAEGLAWMQFLREYGLAGILADDMGLGKTIQTLSHILVEREAGRLNAPALVVAPTSLMANWQQEAARFAPQLRVLTLTGADRAQRFGDIAQADLVLTSYALLPRDEQALCRHSFHLLILDESQYIKNHRAKAAQTAALLHARHRLCLTGTPLQNHLGELWSQFHFLMPGLLGDEKRFNADYRKPIEKQGDAERKALLIRRIKPFLLRRTKDKVAKELPPKTEMVRMVELAGAQRDLYETVRLAMDRKVREAIARKGVARSQIVILDALLKLRQVCCDPRLLKTAGAGQARASSAKLAALMELVGELLDEGRKPLIFSQFTSMLALIEQELQARGVAYALLTGDTVDRAAQVAAFQGGAVPVFLISLKAGGVGLNLTEADTVIHYDPWWNPAAENQATDRAWRIGQDKPVFVYRLIAQGTLEEKIQELQRAKAGLADAVLAGGEARGWQITADDVLAILG